MPRRRKQSEQREMFNPQPGLFADEEEEIDDRRRREVALTRELRGLVWDALELQGERPELARWVQARRAERVHRRTAELAFSELNGPGDRKTLQ